MPLQASDGSVTNPSITNIGDTNTGIFFPAADTIGLVEGGNEIIRINSNGNVGIGTISPSSLLSVSGTATITGNTTVTSSTASTSTTTGALVVTGGLGVGGNLFVGNNIQTQRAFKFPENNRNGSTCRPVAIEIISTTNGGTNTAIVYGNARYGSGKFVVLAAFDPSGIAITATTLTGPGSTFVFCVTDAASNFP